MSPMFLVNIDKALIQEAVNKWAASHRGAEAKTNLLFLHSIIKIAHFSSLRFILNRTLFWATYEGNISQKTQVYDLTQKCNSFYSQQKVIAKIFQGQTKIQIWNCLKINCESNTCYLKICYGLVIKTCYHKFLPYILLIYYSFDEFI